MTTINNHQIAIPTVAYLGREGSYSYIAAVNFFQKTKCLKPFNSIEQVVRAVTKEKAQYGIIPVENSTTGSIFETYDLLIEQKTNIVGEVYLCIHHQLLTKAGVKIPELTHCYSHPQAVSQCRTFLSNHPQLKLIYVSDTATAALQVTKNRHRTHAAIASSQAARLYNLNIAAKNIEDNSKNFTRFAIVSKKQNTQGNKVTLILSVKHIPGSLYRALGPIASSQFNLTKIESRPIIGSLWEYLFIVDFELGNFAFRLRSVLKQLKKHTQKITILGTYDKGKSYET